MLSELIILAVILGARQNISEEKLGYMIVKMCKGLANSLNRMLRTRTRETTISVPRTSTNTQNTLVYTSVTLPVRVISPELHRFASFLMRSLDEKAFREG